MPGEPSVLPVAVFINSNTYPCTWCPLCFLHVGPVLHPSLLHHGHSVAPSPMCTNTDTNTHLNTRPWCATGGYRSPLWKLGRGGVGEGSGAVIIFIIINFHLKVAPGLFCPLQSSFQAPCIHTHHHHCLWKGCVLNKAEQRVGAQKRKELKGMERVWWQWREGKAEAEEAGGAGCVASSLTGP